MQMTEGALEVGVLLRKLTLSNLICVGTCVDCVDTLRHEACSLVPEYPLSL